MPRASSFVSGAGVGGWHPAGFLLKRLEPRVIDGDRVKIERSRLSIGGRLWQQLPSAGAPRGVVVVVSDEIGHVLLVVSRVLVQLSSLNLRVTSSNEFR